MCFTFANRSVNSPSRPPFRSIALLDCAITASIRLGGGYTPALARSAGREERLGANGSKPASLHFLTVVERSGGMVRNAGLNLRKGRAGHSDGHRRLSASRERRLFAERLAARLVFADGRT